ncbi:MAG TPA: TolC family protein [Candidatus Polarisedimenticolia bacterium]|nr:TolC family protein [Candidatus Polarisedimenticolia bacterium]
MKKSFVFLWVLIPVSIVRAAEIPAAVPADLSALLEEAETGNPAIRAAGARLEGARLVPSQVQAAPDPEVSIAYVNDGYSSFTLGESEFSTLGFTWTQEVPYPGKLKQSEEAAMADVAASEKERERIRLEVRSMVKIEYAELYRLDRTRAILEDTKSVLDSLAQAARRRYEVGQGIQESVFKAQTEILRLEAELARVAQDRKAAESRLNAALGRSTSTTIGPATRLPAGALPAEPEALADAAVGASPAVAALQATVRSRATHVERARLDLKPDFLWSASYQNRGGLDPMVAGMFGMRLPIHRSNKQSQAVRQAESELLAAQHDLADLQLRTRSNVRELVSRVQRAEQILALLEQGVIPQARGALESARASYSVGRLGFLDLLNDLVVLLDARTDLATQESERVQSLAALEPALSRDLLQPPGQETREGSAP